MGDYQQIDAERGTTTRREVLLALGAATLLPIGASRGFAAPAGKPGLIDVHRHIIAPRLRTAGEAQRLNLGPLIQDSTERMLGDMDQGGVAKSILTQMTPPALFKSTVEERAAFARDANETMAKLVADHPGRFGFFAELPMPDVDASLKELAYALDTLEADGAQLHTSYGNLWLGDPEFNALYAELNRRRVVVYTHPLEAACCSAGEPDIPATAIEFGTDTARAIARHLFSGAAARYPDMRVIYSHAGGSFAGVMERFTLLAALPAMKERLPNGLDHEVKRLFFDTAQAYHPATLQAMKTAVSASQILFGTDYPYRTSAETFGGVSTSKVFSATELRAICSGNAARLLMRS
jgi:predicted TIM-barrel fold metal-dependent hydrolase